MSGTPASARAALSATRPGALALWMLGAIACVTALAWWDEQRENRAALKDLGTEQSILASSLADNLLAHLGASQTDARRLGASSAELLRSAMPMERAGELMVLVAPPHSPAFYATDGRIVSSPALREALDRGLSVTVLPRAEAARVGLMARTAIAGLSRVQEAASGSWGVVAVATAARERDREARAFYRLILSVLVASGLVFAFGGTALRNQRKELQLEHELAVAEVQRERDQRLLEAQRIATMGTFAMGVVHEVSTPLGIIVGRAEQLLARLKDDDRAKRATEAILQQVDQIQQTIRRFLDLARGGPPSFERADPVELVRSASDAVEHRFAKAQVKLSLDLPTAMPAIQCDRALVQHAIVNLLLNACEACEKGGHVDVLAREDKAHVSFIVTDDGIGISPEHAARATEPFFTTKPSGQGTGLGLAIATEIAKSHCGDLAVAPHAPRGTRASIQIPIAGAAHGAPY
jgi:signal transduction histidine kinase